MSASEPLQRLVAKAEEGHALERHEIIDLLEAPFEASSLIGAAADRVRQREVGDSIYLRGVIEFSNHCERNCRYCGLRKSNNRLSRYRMSADEIIETAWSISEAGIATVVLQSGEDSLFETAILCDLVRRIRSDTNLVVTLSVGERPEEDYRALRQEGADRYLLKHETAWPELYRQLRPGCELQSRIACLQALKRQGYETGTGNMVGLPGQSVASIADDLLMMKELDADMLAIGPFIPHPETPLGRTAPGSSDLALRVIALARLITRDTNIPATSALSAIDPRGRISALRAGANVVMPDFTPFSYRSRYDLYPGRAEQEVATVLLASLRIDCESLERRISPEPGCRRGSDRTTGNRRRGRLSRQ